MITIHSTKKLLAKLPLNEQGLLPKDRRFDEAQLYDRPGARVDDR
ncbi:hypothetical protein [Candidatus Thalassolituus haligoni]|jgi:hypothetical protein